MLHILHHCIEGLLFQADIDVVAVVAVLDFRPQLGDWGTEEIGTHGGYTEILLMQATLFIQILYKIHFVKDLLRVTEKLAAGFCNRDAFFCAVKNFDTKFVFQGLDTVADIALGGIQLLSSLIDGGVFGYLHGKGEL